MVQRKRSDSSRQYSSRRTDMGNCIFCHPYTEKNKFCFVVLFSPLQQHESVYCLWIRESAVHGKKKNNKFIERSRNNFFIDLSTFRDGVLLPDARIDLRRSSISMRKLKIFAKFASSHNWSFLSGFDVRAKNSGIKCRRHRTV